MRACSHGYIRRDHPLQFTSAPLPSLASNSLASAQRKPASRKTCTRPLTHTPPSPTYPRLSSGASKPYHLKRPAQPPPQTPTTHHTAHCTANKLVFQNCNFLEGETKVGSSMFKLNTAIVKRTSGEKKKKDRACVGLRTSQRTAQPTYTERTQQETQMPKDGTGPPPPTQVRAQRTSLPAPYTHPIHTHNLHCRQFSSNIPPSLPNSGPPS